MASVVGIVSKTVELLNDLDTLVKILQDLGKRHVSRGVTANHYSKFAEAFLMTLEQCLATEYTAETNKAWQILY